MDERVETRALGPRRLDRIAHNDKGSGQDLQVVRVAAERPHAAFHVGIEALRGFERAFGREHHLGGFGRELPSGLGRARLNDHRPALDGAGDVERPADRQARAPVVEHVHAGGIEEDPALGVPDEGVVGEAVPEAGDHIVELARPDITGVMVHLLVLAEVQRRVRIGGRDDVPARASAADVVEGREAARDVEGRVEGRRGGRHEPDTLCHGRQGRQQREGLEGSYRMAALQRRDRHVEHREMVRHEEGIELRGLEPLREALDLREAEVRAGRSPGIAPRIRCGWRRDA